MQGFGWVNTTLKELERPMEDLGGEGQSTLVISETNYRKYGFLSTCAYCKISKKVCAIILDALKCQYEIDHTPCIWVGKGRQQRAEFVCTGHNREVYLEQQPGKRQELLLETDKPLIALYMHIQM
jgi:hypothetical protein